MSKFKPGVRVVVIDGDTHEIRRGVIKASYEDLEVAIVKFDDGNVEKVSFDCLGIEPKTDVKKDPETIPEKTRELPDENAEVTITYGEFRDLCVEISMKFTENWRDTLFVTAYGATLAERMFSAKEND